MATLNSNLPEAPKIPVFSVIGDVLKRQILALQSYSQLVGDSLAKIFTPPHYTEDVLDQMDVIGVGSLPIILLTGFFIGGVKIGRAHV